MSIVLIKAAILQYGLSRVFHRKKLKGHWLITLQDGQMFVLQQKEIERLNKKNKIMFAKSRTPYQKKMIARLKDQVHFCFALMVRSLQLKGYEGKEFTESSAIRLLTKKGLKTDHIHRLLGLKRKTKSSHQLTDPALLRFKKKKAVLLYSDSHIVVVSGVYYDNYGKAEKLGLEPPLLEKRKSRGWFELK